jgi:multidrug resistance protein
MSVDPAGARARSPLLLIFLTVFIDLLGFGIVIPLLPVYSQIFHATDLELGLLFASFSGMQLFFAPMWGRISDRIGRRPVLIGGLLGTSVAYVIFAHADSLTVLFLSRIMAGFFGANVSTAQAYIADITTPENRAKGMGLIGAAFGLGFTFGPLIGGELTAFSAAAPGYFAAALSLCAALFGLLMLKEPERARRTESRLFGLDELSHAARDGRIGILLVLSFLFIFSFSTFESMFTLFGLREFPDVFRVPASLEHATREETLRAAPIIGRYLGMIGVLSAIVQGGLIRRLVPRFGETVLAIAGPLFLALSLAMVGLAPAWGVVIAGCALMPFGFGLNGPALNGLISRAAPSDSQGGYLGLNQSILSLARMTGPPCAGLLFDHLSPRAPFLFAAGVLVGAAMLAVYYRGRYGASFARPREVTAVEA